MSETIVLSKVAALQEARAKLTSQDLRILRVLTMMGSAETPGSIAKLAGINTSWPRETAARHCIKLTKLGLAFKSGSPMFPKWEATFEGRALAAAGAP